MHIPVTYLLSVTDDLHSMLEDEGEEYEIDAEKEAVYKDDPKKALKKFFDREGLELEYETEEEGPPRAKIFTVRVRLGNSNFRYFVGEKIP